MAILEAARQKSKRDVEHLVACLHPRPDVTASVRKLPAPTALLVPPDEAIVAARVTQPPPPDASRIHVAPARPAEMTPLAPERYKIQFTVNRETYEQLRRAQDLLRHSIPNGDPAVIFEKALTVLLKEISKTKHGAADRPRPAPESARRSRHIPSAVKRAVWQRDGGACAFIGAQGRRCGETGFLEFHHVVPYSAGGVTSIANLALRCKAHNAFEAEHDFGLS